MKFITAAALVNTLLETNEKGLLGRFFKQIEKLDLLIIDELGIYSSACYETKSLIVTTNLQFGQWNHVFGDPTLTEAVIDRFIHHSYLLIFNGDSRRLRDSILHSK